MSGKAFEPSEWSLKGFQLAKDVITSSQAVVNSPPGHSTVYSDNAQYKEKVKAITEKIWKEIASPFIIWSGSAAQPTETIPADDLSVPYSQMVEPIRQTLTAARKDINLGLESSTPVQRLAAPAGVAAMGVSFAVKKPERDNTNLPFVPDLTEPDTGMAQRHMKYHYLDDYAPPSLDTLRQSPSFPDVRTHPYAQETASVYHAIYNAPSVTVEPADGLLDSGLVVRSDSRRQATEQLKVRLPGALMHVEEPASLNDTPFTLIQTQEELAALVSEINMCPFIAVDVEHNAECSFEGLTCLVQITTHAGAPRDYLLDTLALYPHMYMLRDVFANARILKVFHGARNDVRWLQRDFGIYIVNMLDTYEAITVLDQIPIPEDCRASYNGHSIDTYKGQKSLAALLHIYCGFHPDKRLQTADWTLRPLSRAMCKYAQGDTHYLCYVAGRIMAQLRAIDLGYDRDMSRAAWLNSVSRTADCYQRTMLTSLSARYLFQQGSPGALLSHVQQLIAIALFEWRDSVARAADECAQAVLPDSTLLAIAQAEPASILPIYQLLGPDASPVATGNVGNIHYIIKQVQQGRWTSAAYPVVAVEPQSTAPVRFVRAAPLPSRADSGESFFESIGWDDDSISVTVSHGSITGSGPRSPQLFDCVDRAETPPMVQGPASKKELAALPVVRGTRLRSEAGSVNSSMEVDVASGLVGAGWTGPVLARKVADELKR
ncbi:3'-5' exonuclease [Carpediemonas membranifera]|uniref:3'-5' exonuclease n=1 Tax=Carpediemonas membranifera TaxID=201153 RepID=A0A8J6B3H3_9EUKA|nr:3'-5' exonuclease [Carpediemonas membranifera]|eukprot:KAG9397545.1 3'-5' exonuclease [Carpediemonas membranifera]